MPLWSPCDSNPLVSVIIPTHDRCEQVVRAIASVQQQTWQNWELVVVDDGSCDGTWDTLEPLLCDSRIQRVRQEYCSGVSRARNVGFAHARGALVAYLDSDDLWHKDKLLTQVGWFGAHPDWGIVQTQETWIRHGVRVNPPDTHRKREGDIFGQSLERCMITPSSVMLRREVLEQSGGFNESLPVCEDYDLWLRLSCRYPVGLIDTPLLTRFGGHADQLSSRMGVMDRFRIRALLDLLARAPLTAGQRDQAARMLVKRADIVANGNKKRENMAGYEQYRAIANAFR